MRETRYYEVAGRIFSVTAETGNFALMQNYGPFGRIGGEAAFTLSIEPMESTEALLRASLVEELRQEEEGQEIICGHSASGDSVFVFCWGNKTAGWLVCTNGYRESRLMTTGHCTKMAIDSALMVLYALVTAAEGTVLFHAAVVSYEDKGYMFLGPSGTGKSTHASLWQRYIEGTALVNDDNPVVRIDDDGQAVVYGSPWSGKTPCYRNVSYPLGGIVSLCQAPYNKIRRLSGIHAYAALVPGISGKRWDACIADGLHWTENKLASSIPTWYLECLPDEAAARLCNETITR